MRITLIWISLVCLLAPARAQESSPSPDPSPTPEPAAETSNAPKMQEEVDLTQPAPAENMEIPPPPDEPGPDKAEEIKEPLPDEEPAAPAPPVTGQIDLTAADAGKTVRAATGNLVNITLQSNPSTGYTWELRDFDYGTAAFYKSETVSTDKGNVLFGAPANTVITLQAVKPGAQDIKLVYRRLWEPPDQVAQTFEFRLLVDGATGEAPAPSPAESSPSEATPAP